LNPKKAKELIKPIAEQEGVSEALVRDFTTYFWKEVRKELSEVRSTNLIVQGLGTFKARPWSLPGLIAKYQRIINKYQSVIDRGDNITMQKFAIMKESEANLEKLINIQARVAAEQEKKKTIKKQRNDKQSSTDLEESLEDS
jgi:hypothetical protein